MTGLSIAMVWWLCGLALVPPVLSIPPAPQVVEEAQFYGIEAWSPENSVSLEFVEVLKPSLIEKLAELLEEKTSFANRDYGTSGNNLTQIVSDMLHSTQQQHHVPNLEPARIPACVIRPTAEFNCMKIGLSYRLGSSSLDTTLSIPKPEYDISNVRTSDHTSKGAVVSWDAPNYDGFKGFKVLEYRLTTRASKFKTKATFDPRLNGLDASSRSQQAIFDFEIDIAMLTIDANATMVSTPIPGNMKPNRVYQVEIETLMSHLSTKNTITFFTNEAQLTFVPTITLLTSEFAGVVQRASGTNIKVYLPVSETTASIMTWRITYQHLNSTEGGTIQSTGGRFGDDVLFSMPPLIHPLELYQFIAVPITNFGPGPAGVAVLRINGDIPGHVVSILKSEDVNQTHYRIEWTLDRANGVVSEFELYSESEVVLATAGPDDSSISLPIMLALEVAGVRAVNEFGPGPDFPIKYEGITPELPSSSKKGISQANILAIALTMTLAVVILIAIVLFVIYQRRHPVDAYEYPEPDKKWTVPRNKITVRNKLGSGAFGIIYEGTAACGKGLGVRKVAIKTCSKSSDATKTDFIDEANLMQKLSSRPHANVLQMLGHNLLADPLYIIIEICPEGDLKAYLTSIGDNEGILSKSDYLKICLDIAQGMAHLEGYFNFVHRDLAARNILVCDYPELVAKISDFGMSRDFGQQDYYRKTGEALLPVRWMAPECLLEGLFTTQSDVYAYGVVLWEVYTHGDLPFGQLSNTVVYEIVTNRRKVLERPERCPPEIYEMMVDCWAMKRSCRPHFQEICDRLYPILTEKRKLSVQSRETARNPAPRGLLGAKTPKFANNDGSYSRMVVKNPASRPNGSHLRETAGPQSLSTGGSSLMGSKAPLEPPSPVLMCSGNSPLLNHGNSGREGFIPQAQGQYETDV